MVFEGHQALHLARAEPAPAAARSGGSGPRARSGGGEQLGVGRRPPGDVFGLETKLEGRRRQLQAGELLAQRWQQVGAVARRLGQGDL
jgi:hypothetical protein